MSNFFFELKEGLLISFRAIRTNKIRSVLTTLGIVIGITSVVLIYAASEGIDGAFQSGVSSLGSDNLYIHKWAWFNNDIPWWEMRNRRHISMEDYRKFKNMAKLPKAVVPSVMTNQPVKYDDKKVDGVLVVGTTYEYVNTTNFSFDEGRFFSQVESDGARNVCVIGSEVYKKLFPIGGGLDQQVKIKDKKFKVVGVLEELGSWVMGNFNPDNQVFIPIDAVFKYYQNERRRGITINVKAGSVLMVSAVKEEAISVMRRARGLKYHERDDFAINQQEALLDEINSTIGVVQIAGFFITGLALFVGAIGIMNIMFVSVKERTREIGIRKAIGAKRRSILGQFISESAIICLIGGFIGLVIAVIGSMIITQYDFPIEINVYAVIIAIVISILTGILSGFAPAFSAAKMDPVEALRYE